MRRPGRGVSRGPGVWQRRILRTTGGTVVATVSGVVRAAVIQPTRDDFTAARRATRQLALAERVSATYVYACLACGRLQDFETPQPCCGTVRASLAVCDPARRALVLHPAPPPGGAAPAWMEKVSVTVPEPPRAQVPVASTGDVLSLTLQRYCEQLLSGRMAVSARDVAILMRLERDFRRDAGRDRWAVAQLTGLTDLALTRCYEGLQSGRTAVSVRDAVAIARLRSEFIRAEDWRELFVEDCCNIVEPRAGVVGRSSRELYARFRIWWRENERGEPPSIRPFSYDLGQLYDYQETTIYGRHWRGFPGLEIRPFNE